MASERPQFNSLVLDLEQMQGVFNALVVEEEESEEDDGSDEEDESGAVLDDTAAYQEYVHGAQMGKGSGSR